MPYLLPDEKLIFPHPTLRDPDGLLAIGGSLIPERILLAYRWGVFPWFHTGQPILWWWIAPRLMVQPEQLHISHSVRTVLNQKKYQVTFDEDFEAVIKRCGSVPRRGQGGGTWIVPEMISAYIELFEMGFAHSVEVRDEEGLVGGLYGVVLGKIFFGESMFSVKANASKVGFVRLAEHLISKGFRWIDCQQDTPHMRTLGAQLVYEEEFLSILKENQQYMMKNESTLF